AGTHHLPAPRRPRCPARPGSPPESPADIHHSTAPGSRFRQRKPGVIEEMLPSAGFTPRARGTVTARTGDGNGHQRGAGGSGPFCAALREVIEPLHVPGVGIRIASEFGWITAELRPIDD